MNLPDFLTKLPDGEIVATGHRIGLYHLVEHYTEGDSAEMLACRYSTLSLPLVHKILAFYLENRSEVDAYVEACAAAIDGQQRGGARLDLDTLRRRLAEQKPLASQAGIG
jgi:uncharacterized protein (DUF433 family)